MNVSQEIKTAQEAYAARPYAVRWYDSHYSGEARFQTFEEAFTYVQTMWARIQERVSGSKYQCSQLRQSWLETPEGRVSLKYWLLCKDVSSY